jgi:hypothetical protein
MDVEQLADELIALQCGTHSLGLVYEFLLKTYCDPKRARCDFVRFLSGELPEGLLEEAQVWVAEEQQYECVPADDTLAELAAQSSMVGSLPSLTGAARI